MIAFTFFHSFFGGALLFCHIKIYYTNHLSI